MPVRQSDERLDRFQRDRCDRNAGAPAIERDVRPHALLLHDAGHLANERNWPAFRAERGKR